MSDQLQPARLLIGSAEAARMLSISPRTLWGLTAPRGPIPCVYLRRAVRFDPDDLRRWVEQSKQRCETPAVAGKVG